MAERVIPKTGLDRSAITPSKQEILDPELAQAAAEADEPADEDELDEVAAPKYERENLGPRVGEEVGKANSATAAAALADQLDTEDVVPLIFSKKVNLQDQGLMHHWDPGIHLVPISLAGKSSKEMHWWLRHNGVRRAGKPAPRPEPETT